MRNDRWTIVRRPNLPAVVCDIDACDSASRSQIAAAIRESCRVPCLSIQAVTMILWLHAPASRCLARDVPMHAASSHDRHPER